MNFPDPLIRGTLIKRYQRFLTDVELDNGEIVVAHCANPGSMLNLLEDGAEAFDEKEESFDNILYKRL